jgi:NADH-quinone oxidoreductase subunit L
VWSKGWGFDSLYDAILVKPYVYLSEVNKADIIDRFYSSMVVVAYFFHGVFARAQNGILRWYLVSIVIGAILILTLGLLL